MKTAITDDYQTASICIEIKGNRQLLAIAQRCKSWAEFKEQLYEEQTRAGKTAALRPTFFTHTTNGVSFYASSLNVKRLDELIASL
jgi:hypothetical protein